MNTTELLNSAGHGPWLTVAEYSAAAQLADTIGHTIQYPLKRALVAAEAATELERVGPSIFAGMLPYIGELIERAEDARSTPCGSTEIWSDLMVWVDHKMSESAGTLPAMIAAPTSCPP